MPSLLNFLFGKPLATSEEREEKLGPVPGIAVFGLDALSSAAYGPEAALTILIPLGAAGLTWITPITGLICVLLGIVYFSYRQTIAAYPQGGGSYTVAHENLGPRVGLLAAAALMIDYVLTVAVGISAGVGALISAIPSFEPHTLGICLGILVLLTAVNLRGLREAGALFLLPTWLFIGTLGITIAWGLFKVVTTGGHPQAVVEPPHLDKATQTVGAWLLIRAFASGCTAMTGVEAVSNGVQAFREKVVDNARITLTIIVAILMMMLLGIAFLVHAYGIGAADPGKAGYQIVLSQLIGAVTGRGVFYFISIGAIVTVLSLSANTSFADFPRVCRAVAANRYLPWGFTIRGRRLVYSQGIYVLSFLCALLLIVFRGVTDRLIPLYAVGAFLAFTLSQAGMVAHWRKQKDRSALNEAVNAVGAIATGLTLCVVIVAKFTEGAWMTIVMIPAMVLLMIAIGRHYEQLGRELACNAPIDLNGLKAPLMLVPITGWNMLAEKALRFAMSVSTDVKAVHVATDVEISNTLRDRWKTLVEDPATSRGMKPPELVILESPYRFVVTPIAEFALGQARENPDRKIGLAVTDLREKHWFEFLMHNQKGKTLAALLAVNGDRRIVVMRVPWYVD